MRPALALLFLCLSIPAFAQVNTLERDNPREEARFRVGALYVTPGIHLKELGVDTNVFNEAGEARKDFTFTFTPETQAWLPVARRGLLKLTAATDMVWYKEFASERSLDPHLGLRGEAYLRRLTFFADTNFSRTRQRPPDELEIDVRSRRLERNAQVGVDILLTPKISLELHGRWSDRDWDADDSVLGGTLEQRLNRQATGFGTIARYRMSVLTTFELLAERFEEQFPFLSERNADNVRIMPGVTFEPRALVSGFARIGWRHLNPVDETVLPEFKGLVSDFGLSYTAFGATTIRINHTRDVRYSFELTQPYYVDTRMAAQVRRALGPDFDFELSADRHRLVYEDLLVYGTPASKERVDTLWNYGGSVGYRVGRHGRIGIGVTYWTRGSTSRADREYDALRVRTIATYSF